MRAKRQRHSDTFKAKVALAAIKGDRTLAQLAEQAYLPAVQSPPGTAAPVVPKLRMRVTDNKMAGLTLQSDKANCGMCAMACGLVLMLYIRFFTPIAWTWYVLIGSSATFAIGLALSFLFREKQSATTTI